MGDNRSWENERSTNVVPLVLCSRIKATADYYSFSEKTKKIFSNYKNTLDLYDSSYFYHYHFPGHWGRSKRRIDKAVVLWCGKQAFAGGVH